MNWTKHEIFSFKKTNKDIRNFGLILGVLLVLLFLKFPFQTLIVSGIITIGVSAIRPRWLFPIYFVWMSLAGLIGFAVFRLILIIFYFCVMMPIGLFLRATSRSPIPRHFSSRSQSSYWIKKQETTNPENPY